jgi:hypothetical protein
VFDAVCAWTGIAASPIVAADINIIFIFIKSVIEPPPFHPA